MTTGHIATDIVINCAGMWARNLGAMSGGFPFPFMPDEHFYIVDGGDRRPQAP